MTLTWASLRSWPGERRPVHRQIDAPFKATWIKTLDKLKRELVHLNVKDAVIEVDAEPGSFRRDGSLYADARMVTAGVVLSFTHPKHGPLRLPSDKYKHFDDNVRAIALGLEALRAVDRYGITPKAEQYTGWRALPSSTADNDGIVDVHTAAEFLSRFTEYKPIDLLQWPDRAIGAWRKARSVTHPDVDGGSAQAFAKVERARELLEQHHKVSR